MTRSSYTVIADVAYEDALEVLGTDPHLLLQELTDRVAPDPGPRTDVPLRLELAGTVVERDVAIEVGALRPEALLRATLPLRWEAARDTAWFPSVEATLIVAACEGDLSRTAVTLDVSRHPPLGAAGEVIDRVVGRRLADAVLRSFLTELARRLERTVATIPLTSEFTSRSPVGVPVDLPATARFSAVSPERTVLHQRDAGGTHVLGLEPWQEATLACGEDDVDVTVVVVAGRAQLDVDDRQLEVGPGTAVVVPTGHTALLRARGQRVVAAEVEAPASPARHPGIRTLDVRV